MFLTLPWRESFFKNWCLQTALLIIERYNRIWLRYFVHWPHSLLCTFWKILHSLFSTAQSLLTSPTIPLYCPSFPCHEISLFAVPTAPNLLLYSYQHTLAFVVTSVENMSSRACPILLSQVNLNSSFRRPAWSSRIFPRTLASRELHKEEKRYAM